MTKARDGLMFGVWIAFFPIADLTLRPRIGAAGGVNLDVVREPPPALALTLVLIILSVIIPIVWIGVQRGFDFRRAKYLAPALFAVCISIVLSFLFQYDIMDMLHVLRVYFVSICAITLISINFDSEDFLSSFLQSLAVCFSVAMAAALIDHDFGWGRLMGHTAPNYWGALSYTTILLSLSFRNWFVRAPIIALSLAILYFSGARGSVLALLTAFAVIAFVMIARGRTRPWHWLALALALMGIATFGSGFVQDKILMLADPARGLSSGMTGRAQAWSDTWDLFVQNPWVGVGYRQHEKYLRFASAHNAYLATLAETGIIGFVAYVVFLWGATWRAILQALEYPSSARLAAAGFLASYVVCGLYERAALNTGNPYSMLMIVLAAWAWRWTERPADARAIAA